MLYVKNKINGDVYSVYKKLNKFTYIVNMSNNKVLVKCLRITPYKVVKV